MDIRNCIAELLSLHNCVIIPGFGGFIGNYSPARIDPVHNTFQPPAKMLLFNINLKQNDGLLANAVADSFNISYAEACTMIEEFTEECRSLLKTRKPFLLPGVGHLYSGKEGIIFFEQDQHANLLPDAFGLSSFISPPVIRHNGKKFILPRALKWAAVIALPIGVAAVIGLTQFDRLSANFTNNAGILTAVFSRFSAASLVEKKQAPVVRMQPATMPPKITPVAETLPASREKDHFAVIVGAFGVQENAEKLVAELQEKGFDASIFDRSKSGLFRVTIGTSQNRTDALQLLASVKSTDFSSAWLLAK